STAGSSLPRPGSAGRASGHRPSSRLRSLPFRHCPRAIALGQSRRHPQLSTTARYLEERGFRLHSLAGSKARAGSSEMMLCSPLLSDPVCESKGLPPHQKKEGGEQMYKSISAYRTSWAVTSRWRLL